MNQEDRFYIKRCFELAQKGLGRTSPNPLVGSVVVHNHRIIGEGYHHQCGEAHAEVNALNSVKERDLLPFSTLYVNLEPCSHYGKTPPCALRIIDERVKRVVISNVDPFEKVAGRGIQLLRNEGIEVVTGVLEEEGAWLNRRFFTFHQKKRPYIILKWAQTRDGFMDIDRLQSPIDSSYWITNDEMNALVHKWRTEEDAIMIGSNTAINDNPQLNVRHWVGKNPTRVIIDTEHQITADYHIFDGSVPTILFVDKPYPNLHSSIEQIELPRTQRLGFVMSSLYDRDIQSVIIEGGKLLLQSMIDSNLWDEARVLMGRKFFARGLAAPIVNKLPVSLEYVVGDSITTYVNKNE